MDILIVVVYAPHDVRDKRLLWDYLSHVSNQWAGEVVMMGDFNEVRYKSDRFGSNFNAHDSYKILLLRDDSNAMRNLCGKLKFLKVKIRACKEHENTKFFHGMLNKKRSQLNIRGIMINGTWTDNPKAVKQEFFQHFQNRFDKPPDQNAHIDMPFPNSTVSETITERP
ncbi:RNA-directed DNA polymerase, eukaryota [Tanacetum coccineum]|uniref:RNA-directed DNA polymerase, eukaryota n=1 Tax=Tanacetum coccineum TaxID=301880 RepID=A0ABQ5DKW0_9ASTR